MVIYKSQTCNWLTDQTCNWLIDQTCNWLTGRQAGRQASKWQLHVWSITWIFPVSLFSSATVLDWLRVVSPRSTRVILFVCLVGILFACLLACLCGWLGRGFPKNKISVPRNRTLICRMSPQYSKYWNHHGLRWRKCSSREPLRKRIFFLLAWQPCFSTFRKLEEKKIRDKKMMLYLVMARTLKRISWFSGFFYVFNISYTIKSYLVERL